MSDVIAQTKAGAVRGVIDDGDDGDGIARFFGIPYAKPPFGDLRFAAPQAVSGWEGVRDATAFGATAPKPDEEHSQSQLDFLVDPLIEGDDCLNVNVWTPSPGAAGLPVMVWIHGGAFLSGSSAQPLYDGTSFARDGAVFISMNYRLGVEGFVALPDAPANRGILDLVLALEWVRANAAAFGGDPGNVTVFGESAGAGCVLALLALDRGLFERAVISSAALTGSLAPQDASLVAADIAARAGVAPTAAAFSGVAPQQLANLAKLAWLDMSAAPDPGRWGASTVALGMLFAVSHDGDLLAERPLDLVLAGAGRDVELLMGWTADEMLALVAGAGPGDEKTAERARKYLAMSGAGAGAYEVYQGHGGKEETAQAPSAVLAAAMRDALFRIPALRIADSRAGAAPTFLYEFGWESPIPGLGAAHGLDLGFIFDNLGHSPIEGPTPSQRVANAVHGALVGFAATGNPGWEAYSEDKRPVMVFAEAGGVSYDPRADERRVWFTD